ncbi:MAG: hypothetical protein JWP07_676 [Pseudonocardiales bacterium]|nr:hypothetical protein [Pseudonocardiales bacterium]
MTSTPIADSASTSDVPPHSVAPTLIGHWIGERKSRRPIRGTVTCSTQPRDG